MTFPKDFFWGVGTSAYQIEGYGENGRGPSIWDSFCDGKNENCMGASARIACDHLHRLEEDITLLKKIGVNSYRFSVSWPRVLPEGTGQVNGEGLGFYDRLVDLLLESGIQPHLTLFHWDYPQALQDQGGWLNTDSPDWFMAYTQVIVDQLSDRVQFWYTLNEPACFTSLGLSEGTHAPGLNLPFHELLLATKHAMLAHGKAASIIRVESRKIPHIGFAHVSPYFFTRETEGRKTDIIRDETFHFYDKSVFKNAWWLDIMINGEVPDLASRVFGEDMIPFTEEELIQIAQPLDFLGLNIYFGHEASFDEGLNPIWLDREPGAPHSDSGWPIQPSLLFWAPKYFFERYNTPIVISENGFSNLDWVSRDGRVHDSQRIDFLQRHLIHLQKAIEDGTPIKGYFYWTFLDNFEWTEGYEKRFGLVHVDFQTQERILKDSAFWYRDLIRSDGASLNDYPFKGNYGTYRPNESI